MGGEGRGLAARHVDAHVTAIVVERLAFLVHLAEFFGVASAARSDETYAVIVGRGEKRLGLTVDRLRGQQDVVIKGLDAVVSGTALGVAGATILGDGRVVLVLDVAALFESTRRTARGSASAASSGV